MPTFLADAKRAGLSEDDKGERANLSQSERNTLRALLAGLAHEYRQSAARNATMARRTE